MNKIRTETLQANKSKKVALFLAELNGGGAQRVMVNLAQGLSEEDIQVDLVLAVAEGPYLEEIPNNVRVVDLGAQRTLTSLPGLVRYLRREKPGSILSAMEHANIITIWAAWLARVNVRVVVSVHTSYQGLNFSSIRGQFWHWLIRKFYPFADTVVVVSKAAKNDLIESTKLNPDYVDVIYNPVIMPSLLKQSKMPLNHPWFSLNEPPVILGVGRLSKQKDFPNLIRAFAQVRHVCSARLVIIGEGEDRAELEKLVIDLGIEKDVDLHGFVKNPYTYMAHAEIFVLSSAWEGLPTVLIESLAVGTPVVSTDCPSGPMEILEGGKYGKLVPMHDPNKLAESILDVIQNRNIPIVTEDAITPFSLKVSVSKYLDVLQPDFIDEHKTV